MTNSQFAHPYCADKPQQPTSSVYVTEERAELQ